MPDREHWIEETPPERAGAAANDPLGILASTAGVMRRARSVTIDEAAINRLADDLESSRATPPPWDSTLHFHAPEPGGAARTAGWILALDALNFCFWAQGNDPDHRWRVEWRGTTHDGYDALAAALSRAVAEGVPLWDPGWLAEVSAAELHRVLRPLPGCPVIPLFDARLAHLRELGEGLLAIRREAPDRDPVVHLIERARGSAVELVRSVVARFPSFDDVGVWIDPETGQEREIRFYKRAQILVADLAGALEGDDLGRFDDLAALTAFADYKVPQVLRKLGILVYAPPLAARVQNRALIAASSREEIEIRAATVQACERIRLALAARSSHAPRLTASAIDWLLWNAGQSLPPGSEPYHRTVTVYY